MFAKHKKKIVAGAVALAVPLIATLESGPGHPGHAPYKDIGGVWTDCHGNTENVRPGFIRSPEECAYMLSERATRDAEKIFDTVGGDITRETLASFVSFSYNVGMGAFNTSTLLRKYNAGDKIGACAELYRWVYVGKAYVQGLYNRRAVENELCVRGLYEKNYSVLGSIGSFVSVGFRYIFAR